MATQIFNLLNFKGSTECIKEVLDFVKGTPFTPNSVLDLNQIVPMPEAVQSATEMVGLGSLIKSCYPRQWESFSELLAKAESRCMADTGYPNAQEWALDQWGTIQNVYRCKYSKHLPSEIVFTSAWTPPLTALAVLSDLFREVILELYYEDERATFCGWARFAGGDACDERRLMDLSGDGEIDHGQRGLESDDSNDSSFF